MNIPELLKTDIPEFSFQVFISGEVKNKKAGKHCGLKFTVINDLFVNLSGSLHKYHNAGKHNHNDFAVEDLFKVMADLTNKFQINPFLASLHNLEFGVNVELPMDAKEFLNAIISYKGKEYEKREFEGGGYMLRFRFNHYELKIYDKGLQYGINKNLLRIEIKVKKMEYFTARKIQIQTFADLLNINETKKLIPLLLSAISELLIYDNTIPVKELRRRERELLLNGRNPKFWSALKQNNKENLKYKRRRFRELVSRFGKNDFQKIVLELAKTKLLSLTEMDDKLKEKIALYLNSFSIKSYPEITTFERATPTNEER